MKKIKFLFVFVISGFLFLFTFSDKACASQSYHFKDYNVEVTANEDSTFDVTETITLNFSGEFHRVNRGITLINESNLEKCRNDASLQCGGFSYITVTGVYDELGSEVPESEITAYNRYFEGDDELFVEWEFAPDGENFNNEDFTWIIKYKVYGGIGYFDDYDLFYWNAFPEKRTTIISSASFSITFPEDINFEDENLKVFYNSTSFDYEYDYDEEGFKLDITSEMLPSYEEFTVLLKFPKDIISEYATLNLDLSPKGQNMWIDGIEILDVSEKFEGLPPGSHILKFMASGYEPKDFKLEVEAGEEKDLEVHLERTLLSKFILAAQALANCGSCLAGLFFLALIVKSYMEKGRDIGGRKTIVPWFKPPKGISPVVVGSIKDEKVHMVDITSTIINSAVRGFIKIKEIGRKKYKLIKLKEFEAGESGNGRRIKYDNLDTIEVKILNDIFDLNDEVKTDDLKNKFYLKVPKIQDTIYAKMEERKYFDKRPDKVRNKHLGLGIFFMILGFIASVGLSFIGIFTCGPALIVVGIVKLIFSFFMPAKTALGTDIYEKCKGFRMFLHTAERYRMQKLTPEKFERFLPYAMVFGVEKQWAKNFKDIYKTAPDWYEGRDWRTFNTIYFVNSLSRMNTSVGRVMASSPRSTGSSGWSGGGWSGGGGFSGGFSGGGGGGGSAGAS